MPCRLVYCDECVLHIREGLDDRLAIDLQELHLLALLQCELAFEIAPVEYRLGGARRHLAEESVRAEQRLEEKAFDPPARAELDRGKERRACRIDARVLRRELGLGLGNVGAT